MPTSKRDGEVNVLVLGCQLPALRHHRDGSDVHRPLGAISVGLAPLGVLGGHLLKPAEAGLGVWGVTHVKFLAGAMGRAWPFRVLGMNLGIPLKDTNGMVYSL